MLVSLPKGKCPRLGCRLLGGSYIPKLSEKFSVEAKELAGARGWLGQGDQIMVQGLLRLH